MNDYLDSTAWYEGMMAVGLASSGMSGNTKTLAIGIYEEFSE